MYDFFYRMNTPLWYVIKIPSRYRVLITLSLCLLITSAWFYAVWHPLRASIAMYEQGIHTHDHETSASLNMLDQRALLLDERLQQYASMSDACVVLSPLDTVAEIFSTIERHDLIFCSYQPQGITRHGWYNAHCFLFELKGSFASLHAFFKAIQEIRYVLTVDKVRMNKVDDEQVCATCLFTLIEIAESTKEPHA